MKYIIAVLTLTALSTLYGLDYPPAPPGDVVDDYFGTAVADPYRWLEDVDSDETHAWVEAQHALWQSYLDKVPVRDTIRTRLEEVFDYEYISMPYRRGDNYFFYVNEGLQDHAVFCTAESIGGELTVLIDPNTFEEDRRSFTGARVTEDGAMMAWSTSTSGSDWQTIHFTDLETGEALEDTLRWLKGGVSWNADNSGVFYSMYDIPEEGMEYTQQNRNDRIMFHRLGTPQQQDSLVYARPDKPDWMMGAVMLEDDRHLVIYVSDANIAEGNGIHYIDMHSQDRQVVELLNDFNASYSMLGQVEGMFYILTDLDAPRNRVVAIDPSSPERENWVEILPESNEILETASIMNRGRTLVAKYTWEGYDSVLRYDLQGNFLGEVELPGKGSIWGFWGRQEDTETFFSFTSFLKPGEVYMYDLETDRSTFLWKPEINADLSRFTETMVYYESFDGTRIPMFLVYPENIQLDGSNPLLLTGYGGFGVSMGPSFRTSIIPWLEMGGIYAVPCIRGGGEYGREWHLAGIRENRPTVFRDFIAAAEYLIEEGYSISDMIGISGGSNGGTLVGGVLNMRPDLFGAAAPAMGVMDLLRFHKFTIGWAWKSEYGDPDDPEDVEFLLGYSPYHNIREGIQYPPVLISTADHDDRVVPGHSFKYGARLQAAQAGDAPILMSITSRAGHGGAVGLSESLDRIADRYAFFWEELNM
ncbi:MAG: prolyl oligopeptidase family serine peptidase [Candidatus Aegiribacteria sp.]|nr:prolyl oligopeptidase family serine peptidase [Candidatus Aegiribacteria sp.]MBD3294051.1 prolyl oligopeptidase family serine peptidase [Candidatus Fermentibacteria bacterium]